MATTAANLSEDWKDKYFKALNELDAQADAHTAKMRRRARDLLAVLGRFGGRDAGFDEQLELARRAVSAGGDDFEVRLQDLMGRFERLGDTGTAAAAAPATGQTVDDSVAAVVDALAEGRGYAADIADLAAEIRATESHTRCLALVRDIGERLDTLLGASADASNAKQAARDALQTLLDHLSLPRDAQTRLADITPRLQNARGDDELRVIAKELAAFMGDVISALQAEITSLNGFLVTIKGRLETVSSHVVEESRDHKRAAAAREHLDHTVRRSLDDMRGKVERTQDIEVLKSTIQHQLAHIGGSISSYLETETRRAFVAEKARRHLADQVAAMKKESDQLREKLAEAQSRASRDALTGLPNRVAYGERIRMERARMQRHGTPLTLAVIDIDHFKGINDTWGHQAGDRVLKHLARELGDQVRASDFFARIGGEEFVLVLPETRLAGAHVVLEKLREHIARCRFKYKDAPINVTISCGLAEFAAGESADAAFARADAGLYAAKSGGRNRCEAVMPPAGPR